MTSKVTIKKADNSRGLYLVLDDKRVHVHYAITEDEVELIRDACETWLEQERQQIMADTLETQEDVMRDNASDLLGESEDDAMADSLEERLEQVENTND